MYYCLKVICTIRVVGVPTVHCRMMFDSELARTWKEEPLNWQETISQHLFGVNVENNENRYGSLYTGLDLNRAISEYKWQVLPPDPGGPL